MSSLEAFHQLESQQILHTCFCRGEKKKQTSGNQMESCPGERCLLSPAQTMFWVAWPDLAIGTQNLEALAPSTGQLQCSHTALHPGLLSTLKGEKNKPKPNTQGNLEIVFLMSGSASSLPAKDMTSGIQGGSICLLPTTASAWLPACTSRPRAAV